MVIMKLKVKEHNQIKFSEIKFLKLQVLNLFYGRQVLNLYQIKNFQTNFINQLLETLKDDEFIFLLKTIFGVQI